MALEFLETLTISLISGSLAGYVAYRVQEQKIKKEYQLHDSAQRVAYELMSVEKWPLRSFRVIRHHLGGFDDNELRMILVRSGAIRFMSKNGAELWGLLERNREILGVTRINNDPVLMGTKGLFFGAGNKIDNEDS